MLKLKLTEVIRNGMGYITNRDIEKYIYDLLPESPSILRELEHVARTKRIPIVGPMVGRFLYILAATTGAKHVLEIGTAIGYSAIWLGLAVKRNNGKVITIEIDENFTYEALKNIERMGLAKTIKVINGDGLEVIEKIRRKFDIIFIDDNKQNYPKYLEPCSQRLHENGLLVADNALWNGEVALDIKSKDAKAIAKFNKSLMKRMFSVIIPARDGIAIGIK
ncbi:MAG: O-methyltransferase [Nitrososphaerales archaeon]